MYDNSTFCKEIENTFLTIYNFNFFWRKDFKQKHCKLYRFLYNFTLEGNKSINGNVLIFQKKGNWEIWLLREAYIFEGKKQMKSVGSMVGWAGFLLHTQPRHLLHFGMCFPLTKEARQTDPHSWHLESGKTKLYKTGWIIFWKRIVAFMYDFITNR